jgi:CheY-like chemotaxis protein
MSSILVVEDEINVRKLVAVNLISRGHTVLEARDGHQALERVRINSFDLIVLDIKLPDITGWELLGTLAADPAIGFGGPVLIMTASIMDSHIDLEQYPMVAEVLVKPFSAAKLIAAIERALRPTLSHHA